MWLLILHILYSPLARAAVPRQTAIDPKAVSASSSSFPVPTSINPRACASVSSLSKAIISTVDIFNYPKVPAELAYECINSVPFDTDAAVELLDSIRPYLDWQTTLQYVKDPPAEYAEKVQPPYDFWENWERIYNRAKAGDYAGEYEFGLDLYRSMQQVHDSHFLFYPDSVSYIFSFTRGPPLVCVSMDGTSVPEVYVYSDILATFSGNVSSYSNGTFKPSPLRKINGQESTQWLLDFAENGSLQDRDALWNSLFYGLAQVSLDDYGDGKGLFTGGGQGRFIYPGPTTTLTFANGTTVTFENYAEVFVPFTGIENGADLRKKYFTPPRGYPNPAESLATISSSAVPFFSSSVSFSSLTPTTSTAPAPGYPTPVIREADNLNSGYFLEGEENEDVAVLAIPSFVGGLNELTFQKINTFFLEEAVKQGKTKLIIDLSGNAGGTILQAYDLFKQLFPQILPYGGTRFRAHDAFNFAGEEISYYSASIPRSLQTNLTALYQVSSPFNYRTDVDVNYDNFPNWPAKYGHIPSGPGPDYYTPIIRWNLSDVLTPINSNGIYISGYLKRDNITEQPFEADNIVMVYDGYCGSTCSIFSELMRQQGGVKTIALGGRPNKEIIQAVGGTKGTNNFPYSTILNAVTQAFKVNHYHNDNYYEKQTVLGKYGNLPFFRGLEYEVNARDGIREGDTEQTPLQFVYEPADCRIFYTPEMVVDQSAVWRRVADTAFHGVNHCIAGSYPNAKRDATSRPRFKHSIRSDVKIEEHYSALAKEWTWKSRKALRGVTAVHS